MQTQTGLSQLSSAVDAELRMCMPKFLDQCAAAVYRMPLDGVAIHSGYAVFTRGFDRSTLESCLQRVLGNETDSAVILDIEPGSARLAPLSTAVAMVAASNRRLGT